MAAIDILLHHMTFLLVLLANINFLHNIFSLLFVIISQRVPIFIQAIKKKKVSIPYISVPMVGFLTSY